MINAIKKSVSLLTIGLSIVTLGACGDTATTSSLRSVKLTSPQPREEGVGRNYPALVKESNETGLGFKTAGQISQVYVKEGDYVRQGQLLAALDASDYQIAVNATQVQYDQMKSEFGRITKLFQNKGMSENEYEKAKAGLEQLETQLQANKNKLSYTRLYAPVNGYIQSVNFSKAEMVDAGTQVFSILDDNGMQVEFDVPVSESGNVNSSTHYRLICNGNESSIPVRFISKSPKADGNQLYTVKLGIDGKQKEGLTPGMNATVAISFSDIDAPQKEGYNLPLRSVVNKDGKTSVWVLTPDTTVALREVNFNGVDNNGMAIIISGINAADRVVAAGVNSLHDGEKVMVIEDASETNVGGLM